jgi:hypothetical protein
MGPEVILFIGFFATTFGLYFLRSRENLSMIEKGINPRKAYPSGPRPYAYMRYALLLIGAGVGLFIAFMIDATYLHDVWINKSPDGTTVYHKDTSAIYFALLAIGGGIGLFSAYKIEKKHMQDNKTAPPENL